MKITTDIISAPKGYSQDIIDFCTPVLEVALFRGESHKTFDDEFFFEMLDKEFAHNEQQRILHNAQRYLGDRMWMNDGSIYDITENEFEEGCRSFVKEFLYSNQLKSIIACKDDAWILKIRPICEGRWALTMSESEPGFV